VVERKSSALFSVILLILTVKYFGTLFCTQISELNIEEGDVANLKKFKFLVNGVIKRFKTAYFDESKIPAERVVELEKILADVEAAI